MGIWECLRRRRIAKRNSVLTQVPLPTDHPDSRLLGNEHPFRIALVFELLSQDCCSPHYRYVRPFKVLDININSGTQLLLRQELQQSEKILQNVTLEALCNTRNFALVTLPGC